jgi:hypothetical protein
MVGELLDAARMIGVDISTAAKQACGRDRPHAYDAYHVVDMTCIAPLGFGDIPVGAFVNTFNLVNDGGWVVFNIKVTFLAETEAEPWAVDACTG